MKLVVAALRFGTGGIRAIMGPNPQQLNDSTIAAITQAVVQWLKQLHDEPCVVVARDSRDCGERFARIATEVLAGNGVCVRLLRDPSPTPVLCLAVREYGCTAGIVITASHNAREWNGYKVYDSRGCQATEQITRYIQSALDMGNPVHRMPFIEAHELGLASLEGDEIVGCFLEMASHEARRFGTCKSVLQVVYTPLNGTGGKLVPRLLARQGVTTVATVPEQAFPDGAFVTCPLPNPESDAALELGMRMCEATGSDLLLANDPDADRLGVGVLHEGICRKLTGDEVAVLLLDWVCRIHRQQSDAFERPIAYATVVTTPLADVIARRWGVELRRTLTGFKYIGDAVCQLEESGEVDRFLIGFEESCGYLTGTYIRDKDGMSAAAVVASMASWYKERGMSLFDALHDLRATYGWCKSQQIGAPTDFLPVHELMERIRIRVPKRMGGVEVTRVVDYAQGVAMPSTNAEGSVVGQILPKSDVVEFDLGQSGKVIVRPSGTEPKLKAYVFAWGRNTVAASDRLALIGRDVRALLHQIGVQITTAEGGGS